MYTCSLCRKSYQWPTSLKRHENYKHGQLNPPEGYSCPLCSKRYKWPHDLTKHIKIKHSPENGQQKEQLKDMENKQEQEQKQITDMEKGLFLFKQEQLKDKQQKQEHETDMENRLLHFQQEQLKDMESLQHEISMKNSKHQKHEHISDLETLMQTDYPIPKYMVFKHPFTMLISGPSGCGKTVFVRKLLQCRGQMVDQDLQEIIWCHGIEQPLHLDLKKEFPMIEFIHGLPDPAMLSRNKPQLVILDDLMNETKGNIVANLFAKGSHHTNTSVIYITQNLFPKNKENRDISLNTKYIVVFKNPRDGQQITTLGIQMKKQKLITEAFQEATKRPHGYLMLDVTQDAVDELRFRTQIFPDDAVNIVFLP